MVSDPDFSDAVEYHYGEFPPENIDAAKLLDSVARAAAALGKYDAMLQQMHNSEILLGPLRNQEAVISSRMEGTVTTLDEVLKLDAEEDGDSDPDHRPRSEVLEVLSYSTALRRSQLAISEGRQISESLIKDMHRTLLRFGRGASDNPGAYKTDQNYLADRRRKKILFVPINPIQLTSGMENLIHFMNDASLAPLINVAISHVEFEALHPFNDGNGRLGRMLITLSLWQHRLISEPHFYISGFFEEHRDEYIDLMREVSADGNWTAWISFFLKGIEHQANANLEISLQIRNLYEEYKAIFLDKLSSKYHISALDFLFEFPIFRNNKFTSKSGIPKQTASRFSRLLIEENILTTIDPAAGRRPALLAFEPLLRVIRA